MKDRVLRYIREFGSINTKQAFVDLGCTRLSEYIRQLRQEMTIKDRWVKGVNRFNEKTEWKEYYIEEN